MLNPSLTTRIETTSINEITLSIPWEELDKGPIGEYMEVVDYDPASDSFYEPVDLNHPCLLAQNGLPPSESNPQFHQQMAYAVAMKTIKHFERALGRGAILVAAVNKWALGVKPNPWRHPLPSIKQALLKKTRGRVFQTDTRELEKPEDMPEGDWEEFIGQCAFEDLYFDYTVLDE